MALKVAYLINQYPHASHSFVRREILALESLGLEVHRMSIRRSPEPLVDPSDREEEGKTTFILDGSKVSLLLRVLLASLMRPAAMVRGLRRAWAHGRRSQRPTWLHFVYLIEAVSVAAACRRAGVDHIHAHFGTNASTVAMLARDLGGAPFSFTVHGPEEFDRPDALSLGDKISACEFVAGVSSFGRSQLFRWCSIDQWSKVKVVRCGLDPDFLEAAQTPIPEAPKLLYVGRLCEQKGPSLLIRALGVLRQRGVRASLVMIGDGEPRGEVEAEIRHAQITDSVELRGWGNAEEIRNELRASRALVLPSFAEGLPVVLMESLALHRPVVTTYIAGIPELVRPPEGGWLVPAGSVSRLADALQEVIESTPDELAHRAEAGAQRVAVQHNALREASVLARHFGADVPEHGPVDPVANPAEELTAVGEG